MPTVGLIRIKHRRIYHFRNTKIGLMRETFEGYY